VFLKEFRRFCSVEWAVPTRNVQAFGVAVQSRFEIKAAGDQHHVLWFVWVTDPLYRARLERTFSRLLAPGLSYADGPARRASCACEC
jgi:hypothetical protein